MNDNEGPWVELGDVMFRPLSGGCLRAVSDVKLNWADADHITVTATAEVRRDATIRDVECALLEDVQAKLQRLGVPTLAELEARLSSTREEIARFDGPMPA